MPSTCLVSSSSTRFFFKSRAITSKSGSSLGGMLSRLVLSGTVAFTMRSSSRVTIPLPPASSRCEAIASRTSTNVAPSVRKINLFISILPTGV